MPVNAERDYERLYRLIVRVMLTAVAIFVVLAAAWKLLDLLILVFGALVIAVLIRALADWIADRTPLKGGWSVAAAILSIVATLVLLGVTLGSRIQEQFADLLETLPSAWSSLRATVQSMPGGEYLVHAMESASPAESGFFANAGTIALVTVEALVNLMLVLFGAVFLAGNPRIYRTGLLKLVPERRRALAGEALSDSGRALKRWLLGQLVSMAIVGALTGIGLWMLGVPSALALGVVAGVAEAIPYAGPVIAAIPGLLIALLAGPQTALWTLFLYVAIQQIEGTLVMPIIQKRAVSLPPALTVFGIVAAGLLFGTVGLIFAAPLLVVAYVMVKKLYVQEALGTDTPIPGEK
jgi:predicted PurR-regulated permease PerM